MRFRDYEKDCTKKVVAEPGLRGVDTKIIVVDQLTNNMFKRNLSVLEFVTGLGGERRQGPAYF